MIETLRIQNFKSIKDATVNLKDVNLLIGPNNSGKSNFFAALELLRDWFLEGKLPDDLEDYCFKKELPNIEKGENPMIFTLTKENNWVYQLEIFSTKRAIFNEFIGVAINKIDNITTSNINSFVNEFSSFDINFSNNIYFSHFLKDSNTIENPQLKNLFQDIKNKSIRVEGFFKETETVYLKNNISSQSGKFIVKNKISNDFLENIFQQITSLKTYSIEVNSLKKAYPTLANERQMNDDGSNLVAFLDNMRDENPKVIQRIEKDLKYCIPEFTALRFQKIEVAKDTDLYKIHGDKTYKKIGLYDKFSQTYWANELSEGTLYFLALLAIIHQPNPPKLLLLEEPEKGIHPRRISEIMDFIFELAELKNIQAILSTHSTQVVDEFKEMPENIFVFDKPDDATIIRNLQTDILDVDNEKLKAKGIPPIELNGSLGQHWANGILGGVPAEVQ